MPLLMDMVRGFGLVDARVQRNEHHLSTFSLHCITLPAPRHLQDVARLLLWLCWVQLRHNYLYSRWCAALQSTRMGEAAASLPPMAQLNLS